MSAGPLRLEPLRAEHWPEVAAIYREGIATRLATFETEVPDYARWDAAHLPEHRLVALQRDEVAGFVALSPVSERLVYAGVAEVSVYVAAAWRGQGVGGSLMRALVAAADEAGIWTLQAGVFPENAASLRLHESLGFRVVGRRERLARLDGLWRDVLLLERRSAVVS